MQIVSDAPDSPVKLVPIEPSLRGPKAANDSGVLSRARYHTDLNVLVAGVVGHVAGRVQPEYANIELHLAAGEPLVNGDPTELAFAVSGVLSAQLRALDEVEGGVVRVEILADVQLVQILMTGDELPPLPFVRALDHSAPGAGAGAVDPTLAHCRRLVEAHGGTIALTEQGGRIGFSIAFPRITLSPNIHLLPARVALLSQPRQAMLRAS